jgi:hypothetical protein
MLTIEMRIWGLSKQAAHYQKAPEGEGRCDHCKYMFSAAGDRWVQAGCAV